MEMTKDTYDVVGIGFGPANIALAIALEEKSLDSNTLYLECNASPDWQSEMLLDGSDIQHNPLRDFVTPRNPLSPYGFLSYLKSQDRLFDYLNLGLEFPLRKDYANYVKWVANHFSEKVSYQERVLAIYPVKDKSDLWCIETSKGRAIYAKTISFGTGRTPHIPPEFNAINSPKVVHFTRYLSTINKWGKEQNVKSVAIVGGSQSAVELVLDVSSHFPNLKIHNLLRSYSYQMKDVSPFTEHIYFPKFVDEFHSADAQLQNKLTSSLWRSNYSSADQDVIHALYLKMYEDKLDNNERIYIHNMTCIKSVVDMGETIKITYVDTLHNTSNELEVDSVILATGFKNMGSGDNQESCPPLLADIYSQLECRQDGSIHVDRDYQIKSNGPELPSMYLNGICESTHGFGDAGSFSLLSYRAWTIAESIENVMKSQEFK